MPDSQHDMKVTNTSNKSAEVGMVPRSRHITDQIEGRQSPSYEAGLNAATRAAEGAQAIHGCLN